MNMSPFASSENSHCHADTVEITIVKQFYFPPMKKCSVIFFPVYDIFLQRKYTKHHSIFYYETWVWLFLPSSQKILILTHLHTGDISVSESDVCWYFIPGPVCVGTRLYSWSFCSVWAHSYSWSFCQCRFYLSRGHGLKRMWNTLLPAALANSKLAFTVSVKAFESKHGLGKSCVPLLPLICHCSNVTVNGLKSLSHTYMFVCLFVLYFLGF